MDVQFRSHRGAWPAPLRERARRRLDFALDRFAGLLRRIRVHSTREGSAGRRPGPHRCRLVFELRGARPSVVVTARGGDVLSALARAVERGARAVSRASERRHGRRRPSTHPAG